MDTYINQFGSLIPSVPCGWTDLQCYEAKTIDIWYC